MKTKIINNKRKPRLSGVAKPPGVRDMGGKSKGGTIMTGNKVKEIAAIVSAGRGDKQPKLAGTSSLTNPITNQTGPDPVVHNTDDNNSKQNNDRLAELERKVRDMTVSPGAVVVGVDDAEGERDGAVVLEWGRGWISWSPASTCSLPR